MLTDAKYLWVNGRSFEIYSPDTHTDTSGRALDQDHWSAEIVRIRYPRRGCIIHNFVVPSGLRPAGGGGNHFRIDPDLSSARASLIDP